MKLSVLEKEQRKFPAGYPTADVRPHCRHHTSYYGGTRSLSQYCISTSLDHTKCTFAWCQCVCHETEDYLQSFM